MEKQNNTKKYIKISGALLVSAVFALSLPVLALAQYEDTGTTYVDPYGYTDTGTTYVDPYGYTNTGTTYVDPNGYVNTGTTYIDPYGYTNTGTTYVEPTGYTNTGTTYVEPSGYTNTGTTYVEPTGYTDTGTTYVDSYGYTNTGTTYVSSGGGYYGGSYGYGGYSGGSSVYSGGYTGGVPATPTYYVGGGPLTVYSGGYSGGTSASYYYYPPVTTTYIPPVQNQVLAYNDTPTLSSVALSDVPYTGAGDVFKVLLFAIALTVWSLFIALAFLKRKARMQIVPIENSVLGKTSGANKFSGNFSNSVDSDEKAIEDLGNYARLKKVLLSSDASVKLVKLQRLENINLSNLINKISGGDWVAVGEKDLQRYM